MVARVFVSVEGVTPRMGSVVDFLAALAATPGVEVVRRDEALDAFSMFNVIANADAFVLLVGEEPRQTALLELGHAVSARMAWHRPARIVVVGTISLGVYESECDLHTPFVEAALAQLALWFGAPR